MTETIIIIMAGGLGKRMNSDLPKVLHKIDGQPMLYRVIEQSRKLNPFKILIVMGKYQKIIESVLKQYTDLSDIISINQPEPLGTGHAIMCCREYLLQYVDIVTNILILSGDVPLIQSETLNNMLDCEGVKIMTAEIDDPKGYGRIYENHGQFQKIIEEKDCTDSEKLITKINCGIYCFNIKLLCKYLPYIQNKNAQSEYYLTDIVEIIKNNELISIDMYNIPKNKVMEINGVNTLKQLEQLEQLYIFFKSIN